MSATEAQMLEALARRITQRERIDPDMELAGAGGRPTPAWRLRISSARAIIADILGAGLRVIPRGDGVVKPVEAERRLAVSYIAAGYGDSGFPGGEPVASALLELVRRAGFDLVDAELGPHLGYFGTVEFDPAARAWRGWVKEIVDAVDYEAGSRSELENAFRGAVEAWLEDQRQPAHAEG